MSVLDKAMVSKSRREKRAPPFRAWTVKKAEMIWLMNDVVERVDKIGFLSWCIYVRPHRLAPEGQMQGRYAQSP